MLIFGIFLTVLLAIGFGLEAWSLAGITIVLTMGLAIVIFSSDLQAMKDDFANRRCGFDGLVLAFLLKPDEDKRSASEFAENNLFFCAQQIFQTNFKQLLAPLLSIISTQINSSMIVTKIMNMMRQIIATMWRGFQKILEPLFRRFNYTGMAAARTFRKLMDAMERAGAIAIASLYAGISLQISIENFVKFVVKVVIIMIYIIAALFIFLFIGILPVLPLLIITLMYLEENGFGYMTGSVGAVFCFARETEIILSNGTRKKIGDIVLGDEIEGGSIVQGILETDGSKETLYELDGILVSGAHLIMNGKWATVAEHPNASRTAIVKESLICLKTSDRLIRIQGKSEAHIFRDWEEITDDANGVWEDILQAILNGKKTDCILPTESPLLGLYQPITMKTGVIRPLCEIIIGDEILSSSGSTKVIGVYKSTAVMTDVSDGIWEKKKHLGETKWKHPIPTKGILQKGMHLITESGDFWIKDSIVRDFTEVGIERLPFTYPYVLHLLNKK